MTPDIIHLTPAGSQALLNADSGGILVAPKYFKVGNLEVSDVEDFYEQEGIPENLVSTTVHQGKIQYIQVLSETLCGLRLTYRLVFLLPKALA